MDTEENKTIIRHFVERINAQDWQRLADLVAPDFVRHSHAGGAPGIRSRDDLIRFLRGEVETFPDAHESIADLVADGDRVAVRHHFRGTQTGPMGPHPPTGRVMEADYLAIYRLAGGRIAEAWAEWDNLAGLVQLGHLSQPTSAPATASQDALAITPPPPYYAVIFSSIRTADPAGYAVTAERMIELATQMPGFLGVESTRGTDGLGITVSYWSTEEAIRLWQRHAEHLQAQRLGRERWYAGFELRVCRVERASGFRKEE